MAIRQGVVKRTLWTSSRTVRHNLRCSVSYQINLCGHTSSYNIIPNVIHKPLAPRRGNILKTEPSKIDKTGFDHSRLGIPTVTRMGTTQVHTIPKHLKGYPKSSMMNLLSRYARTAFSGTWRGALNGFHTFSLLPVNQDHDGDTSRICLSDSASHAGFFDIGHNGRKAYVGTPTLISSHSHDFLVNLGLTMREQKPHCQLRRMLR